MGASTPSNRKAIVCEDEALTSARLAQQLGELGYEVAALASDGLQAVEAAQTHRPDLILMDIKMPGMDGLEAARLIRHEQPTAAIVVITAHVNDGFIDRAMEAGVEGYLVKPVSPEQLRVALSLAVSNSHRLSEARDEAESARTRLADRRTIERAKGILMDTQGLSERDAYRRLQKRSQDERRPMAELADEIIRAHSLLSKGEPATGPDS
jgi:response regulator NasT